MQWKTDDQIHFLISPPDHTRQAATSGAGQGRIGEVRLYRLPSP